MGPKCCGVTRLPCKQENWVELPVVPQISTFRPLHGDVLMYTVYKVTNQLTQDFYIGVHKTDDPNDDYLGSGKVIRQQVALHGPENFTKEILLITEVRREAYQKEEELVRPLLGTPGCLNIHPGGHGGFGYINRVGGSPKGGNHDPVANRSRREKAIERFASDPGMYARMLGNLAHYRETRPEEFKAHALAAARVGSAAWVGCKHRPETISKLKALHSGGSHPQFGSVWMHNPDTKEVRKAQPGQVEDFILRGWVRGRKVT